MQFINLFSDLFLFLFNLPLSNCHIEGMNKGPWYINRSVYWMTDWFHICLPNIFKDGIKNYIWSVSTPFKRGSSSGRSPLRLCIQRISSLLLPCALIILPMCIPELFERSLLDKSSRINEGFSDIAVYRTSSSINIVNVIFKLNKMKS